MYVLTRREAGELADALSSQPGLTGRVGCYHGELPPAERKRVHHAFLHDKLSVVVATVAFGMVRGGWVPLWGGVPYGAPAAAVCRVLR